MNKIAQVYTPDPYLCAMLQLKLVEESPSIPQIWLNLYGPEEPLSRLGDLTLTPEQPDICRTSQNVKSFIQKGLLNVKHQQNTHFYIVGYHKK